MSTHRLALVLIALLLVTALLVVSLPVQVRAAPDLSRVFFELPSKDNGPASSVSVSQDGSTMVTGTSSTGNVTVYSVSAKKELWTTSTAAGNMFGVTVSGDGSVVYAFDGANTVRMFSVSNGNVSEWSYPLGAQAYNVVTDHQGKIAIVGAQGKAFLFNQSGFVKVFDAGDNHWMYVAMTPDGRTAVGACGKSIYLFDSGLNVTDTQGTGNNLGSIYNDEVSVAISDDGQTVVASYLEPLSVSRLVIIKRASGNSYYPIFGSGDLKFCLSGDGKAVFLADNNGIYLYDTVSGNLIWNRSMERPPYQVGISVDGSMITATYLSDGLLRIYGKSSSAPIEEIYISSPHQCILSGDGSTMVVTGNRLTAFRPSIAMEVSAQGAVIWPNFPVVDIRASENGHALLGANVTADISAVNATYEVTEKGSGYYELRITAFEGGWNSYIHFNITVSKIGLGNISQEGSAFIQPPAYTYYPSYPSAPDYSGQLNDLGSQVGGLQIIVIILALSVIALILFIWKPRRPEKQSRDIP